MIAEVSWGQDFGGIVDYLTKHRDHEVLDLRNISSIETAADEMAFTARFNKRVTARVCHVSLSAAHEDGILKSATWLSCVEAVEAEFGLEGHHRVVVRHKDKTHDHVHIFWCTVSPDSFKSPPRQWFLARGAKGHDAGALALTPEEIKRTPADQRAQGSWNRRALIRLQQLCRTLEKQLKLRQLRTPRQIAKAREQRETRPADVDPVRREDRTGARPLIDMASMIRTALDAPSWPDARAALARIGLGLEPALRAVKNAEPKVAGLIIHDLADPGNRMPASQLDIAGRKYGLRQIEKRHDKGAPTMDAWWPDRGPDPLVGRAERANDPHREQRVAYALERERHRMAEVAKAVQRNALRAGQKREKAALARKLKRQRATEAAQLQISDRRAFYASFSRHVRLPELAALAKRHREETRLLRRSRMPTWQDYRSGQAIDIRPAAVPSVDGDIEADLMKRSEGMRTIQPKTSKSTERKAIIDSAVNSICRRVSSPALPEESMALLRPLVRKVGENMTAGWLSLRIDGNIVVASSPMADPLKQIGALEQLDGGHLVLCLMAQAVASFDSDPTHSRYSHRIAMDPDSNEPEPGKFDPRNRGRTGRG